MTRLRAELPALTRRLPDDRLAEVEADAIKRVKPPKPRRQVATDEGYYHAVVLDEPAWAIVSVVEGKDKQVDCVLEGQIVRKLHGPFAPPVTVTYITGAEHDRFHADVIGQVKKALER